MNIEDITPVLLKQTLNTWRQAKPAPPELLHLDMLAAMGAGDVAE